MPGIVTYDTTLRDGAQREGVSLSLEDKLRIAARLDDFGIDYIEGGFPGSNPKDAAFFSAYASRRLILNHAQLVAFGTPARKGRTPEHDPDLQRLVHCAAPVITLVGKASERHAQQTLQVSGEENLRMIFESTRYLIDAGKRVFFNAEHFFDGYLDNPQYAFEVLVAAQEAGVEYLVLADTNGGMLPHQIESITREALYALSTQYEQVLIGIHAHNDSGCGVANTLQAVLAGASMVQGTVNGYGERVGNANLLTIIANLELKLGCELVGPECLQQLTSLSRFVADTMNIAQDAHAPYVGENAFAHKGGMHVSAEQRMKDAYQHIDPTEVGNFSHLVISELAGQTALKVKAEELGLDISTLTEDRLRALIKRVKEREEAGYSYEAADASLALLIEDELGSKPQFFSLESFRVITERRQNGEEATEATIKIHVGDERFIATAEGNGPVSALDRALRAAIIQFYPQLEQLRLHDFKVRVLDGSLGTDAITRVAIETSSDKKSWGTVGVNENIIEASWDALVDAITYGLMKGIHEQQ